MVHFSIDHKRTYKATLEIVQINLDISKWSVYSVFIVVRLVYHARANKRTAWVW
jgi:hypothetical protein